MTGADPHADAKRMAAMIRNLGRAPASFRAALELAARNWAEGWLEVVTPDGKRVDIKGPQEGPHAALIIRNYAFVKRIFSGGDVGFAEGWMAGEWDTPDLSRLLEVLGRNYDRMSGLVGGNLLVRAANRIMHALNRNSRAGAKRNIHAHYDLGNEFYARWLDPTMTYSSAWFERPGQDLAEAQVAKYRALAGRIGLKPDERVLEIGCGWGGFAEFAAREVGAKVTGVTISQAQFEFARKRLFEAGLSERADIRLVDYRDVEGRFNKVASIEMFEAVGEQYWPAYFAKVRDVLEPGGRAGLQIITIKDELYHRYRNRPDFIQKYVFPGGALPSEVRLREETARAGLNWDSVARFGQAYADTLALWSERFSAAWEDIRPLGFDERFRRLWSFYLSYCEAGFRTGRTDVIQLVLDRA
jgi:cyclopropane-fatty-acyl-phospholipid synthase